MKDDIKFCDVEAYIDYATPTSAHYKVTTPDLHLGNIIIGSLDVHFPSDDRSFFVATLAIDSEHNFNYTSNETISHLVESLDISECELWKFSLVKTSSREDIDNDPKVLHR